MSVSVCLFMCLRAATHSVYLDLCLLDNPFLSAGRTGEVPTLCDNVFVSVHFMCL